MYFVSLYYSLKTEIMKKNIFGLAILALVIGTASCSSSSSGGGFESDVRKMADYRCRVQKLEAKDPADEKAKKELEDLRKEMDEYRDKMAEKYKGKENDTAMNNKADKIMDEEMAKCK
jgi:hypothetical protein